MYFKNHSLHCSHLKPVNDVSNGFHVCQDCGKVLEPVYYVITKERLYFCR